MNRSTPFFLAAMGLALLTCLLWATPTPAQAAAATPTTTTTPITQTVTATRNANLRSGPGTTYKVIGAVKAGQQLTVTDHNPAGDWLQLDTGAWIAAFLVKPATAAPPSAAATATPTKAASAPAPASTPTPPPPTATAAPEPIAGPPNVALLILTNHGSAEILAIRNDGSAPVNISGWWLNGSKGDETCTIPAGTVLDPGALYQIATGDSAPSGPGYSCGNKPIWNNGGETIYLHLSDGQTLSIESVRV